MAVSSVLVYNKIKDKVGEEGARFLIEFVEDSVRKGTATKEDLGELKGDLREEITNTKAELKEDIANFKADIIKWMFIFWVGNIATIIAIIKIFFK